jgi:glycosyltransferase involved in cell wall biosynthesis
MKPHLVCVGGEDHALRVPFLLAMRDRGFRVSAVSTSDGKAFDNAGIAHSRYAFDRFASRGGEYAAVGALRRAVAELRPDVVQSFDTKPNLLTPMAMRGAVPVVRTINGLGWVFSSTRPRALALRPIYCGLQWHASRWTATTVFQNRDDKAFFERRRLLRRSESVLIRSSGIDVEGFLESQARVSPDSLRAELGLGSAEIVIFVGRLTQQKGIPTLLEAAPHILKHRPNARFLLVGSLETEGPFAVERATIERHAPYVTALGARKDVPALLSIANVFVLPTEYREGIPRVLLEAGLAGLPIVATRMPGCNDVVEDGRNGYLVPPRDPQALADRIVGLLDDPARARSMGAPSAAMVRENFDLAHVVDQYGDVYQRALKGSERSTGGYRAPLRGAGHETAVEMGGAGK